MNYYRIRQVDFARSNRFSEVRQVLMDKEETLIIPRNPATPQPRNPATELLYLRGITQGAVIITKTRGQVVFQVT